MIEGEIINFFKKDSETKGKCPPTINSSSLLIESGILDSFGIIKLIIFLEQKFDIKLDSKDLVEENFYTLKRIVRLVINKQKND